MLHIPVIFGHRPGSANRRGEMWSKRPSDKEVPPQNPPRDESGPRRTRDNPPISQQREYRDVKDDFRRKHSSSSRCSREWSPRKRDVCFFRKSSVGRKDSPHSKSGCRGRQSPKRSRPYSSRPSQHRKLEHAHASYRRHSEGKPEVKEKPDQSLKASRDMYPSSSSAVPSSKMLDRPNRLTEELLKTTSKQTVEKPETSNGSDLPKISEFEIGFMDQPEESESNRTVGTELVNDDQITNRLKAIASKTEEIEQAYHQDCETFGMVVEMLIDKDPSLEKPIQFALRQNLHEISERCVTELNHFIAEYDASTS
uniref:RIKEN cDNA 3110001I22 gene n=1 Tax=Nannospalax galili TaxID=1026970 RepID=A0A8C6QM33_NANGA